MKKRLILLLAFVILVMAMAGCAAHQDNLAEEPKDILVLFTSDVHCGVDRNFGYVGLRAAADAAEAQGDHVLLVDNGDSIQGEPIGTLTNGEAVYHAVQQAVNDARDEGADYVVVMGHMGNEAECEPWTYADVISHTEGIDAFLDGHSHDTDKVVMKNKNGKEVIRQACGTKMNGIGWLRIRAEDGNLDTGLYTWNNDISAPELLGLENSMSREVEKETGELNKKLSEVVAHSAEDLIIEDPETADESGTPVRIVRRAETNLGDLCADAYRDQSGADIAFVNGGGIRTGIPQGEVTMNDILKVHPFGNMLTVIEVSGQQILDALEWGARAFPGEDGGFLQVSGLTYEIHTYLDSNCTEDEDGMFTGVAGEYRVKNVRIGGKALIPDQMYTLASHNYMLLEKGDGYAMFDGCTVLQDSVKLDNQVLIDYISDTLGGIIGEEYADPYGQGRIIAVEEAP